MPACHLIDLSVWPPGVHPNYFRFCGAVGAGSICDEVHAALDIKHLMLDTLGWVLPRILAATSQVILSLVLLFRVGFFKSSLVFLYV